MHSVGQWIWCGAVALMGVMGLFVAAQGGQSVPYWGGLAFFAFSVLFVFYQIKLAFDRRNSGHH